MADFNPAKLDLYLKEYYYELYPSELVTKWLKYEKLENEDYLANREFAFILKDDLHLRYLSFKNVEEFRDKLCKNTPYKIDIGAVYSRPPCDRKKVGDFTPQERELVFDIDLTDYDAIRSCCTGTSICQKCWRWISIAVKVLERLLRGHFGFKHLLWVFSGRRGIHCWVADGVARKLNNRGREAVTKYLTFDRRSQCISKQRIHPMAEHSFRAIMDCGEMDKLMIEQKWLESSETWTSILDLCEDPELRVTLENEFIGLATPELRWELLKVRFDEVTRNKKLSVNPDVKLPNLPSELGKSFFRTFILTYAYPRLDEKVSTGLNHLLKSPFSVHPKNGNVAIPLNAKAVDRFLLSSVPRIDKLSMELKNASKKIDQENHHTSSVKEQTSLAPFIDIFKSFVEGISRDA